MRDAHVLQDGVQVAIQVLDRVQIGVTEEKLDVRIMQQVFSLLLIVFRDRQSPAIEPLIALKKSSCVTDWNGLRLEHRGVNFTRLSMVLTPVLADLTFPGEGQKMDPIYKRTQVGAKALKS